MRGGWIVGLWLVGACTAPNPAFGEADDGSGSTSKADETTDKPTTDPTIEPTQPSSTSDDDTSTPTESSGMGPGTHATMTSDDAGTDDDTSTPTTSTAEDSSDGSTGNATGNVLLFVGSIQSGQFAVDGAGTAMQAGADICIEAAGGFQADVCTGTYHALIRASPMPFEAPEIVDNLGRPVVSLDSEPVAETLEDFLEGNWLVPALSSLSGGGFDMIQSRPIATGGSSNTDFNCEGWTTEVGEMTIAAIGGGGGWFDADETPCSTPANILCLCLP